MEIELKNDWNKNKLAGNTAEAKVECLINSMPDWKCLKFGIENHIQDIRELVKDHLNPITKKIKCMPDFIAFNIKTKETYFIEVKYRAHNKLESNKFECKINFLEQYKEYWPNTKLIILRDSDPLIFVVDLDKIDNTIELLTPFGAFWDFSNIHQDIKTLFPDLKDETIKEVIK